MNIEKKPFGQTKNGKPAECYTLSDGAFSADIITYGAAIRSINVPVGGTTRDVALGFDTIADYEANKCFHGAAIGRVGNRVANAQYKLGGKTYHLDVNDGAHSLHGGFVGFDKQVFSAQEEPGALTLTLFDREGTAAGYPGDMTVSIKYTLGYDEAKREGSLSIEYAATCTEDTPVNLTNHCYFNLAGHASGSIANHKLQIISDSITPVDSTLIPTGKLMDVTGTPFDFRNLTPIAPGLESDHEQIKLGGGYDHNWVLAAEPVRPCTLAAKLECSGVSMEVHTTKPGIQFYAGNMMVNEKGKEGVMYSKRTGLCLETQYWPNSVNTPSFPAPVLMQGETYKHKTIYKFKAV